MKKKVYSVEEKKQLRKAYDKQRYIEGKQPPTLVPLPDNRGYEESASAENSQDMKPTNRHSETTESTMLEGTEGSSNSSRSATPHISNPGTPRTEAPQDMRNTPPLPPPVGSSASSTSAAAQQAMAAHQAAVAQQAAAMAHLSQQAAAASGHMAAAVAAQQAAVAAAAQQQTQAQSHKQQTPVTMMPATTVPAPSKYGQLLAVIEDMGRDIRPTYSGSKSSAERLKRGIVHARILVRECLMECERSART